MSSARSKSLFDADGSADIRAKVVAIVDRTISAGSFAVTRDERLQLIDEVIADVGGFGPLEPLLHDESITESWSTGPDHI